MRPLPPTHVADAADRAATEAARLTDLADADIARAEVTIRYARSLTAHARSLNVGFSELARLDAGVRQGASDRARLSAAKARGEATAAHARATMAALESEAVYPIALEALATYPHPIRLYAGLLWRALYVRVMGPR